MKKSILIIIGLLIPTFADARCNEETECFFKNCIECNAVCPTACRTNGCGNIFGKTFFSQRPQDSNSVRRIMWYLTKEDCERYVDEAHHHFDVTFEYQHSFRTAGIAEWFFFNGNSCMSVGIPDATTAFDVDGSQLGLSLGTTGSTLTPGPIGNICACPSVANFIADFYARFDLCQMMEGLWFALDLPVVWTRTNMRFCAKGQGRTDQDFPAGLFGVGAGSSPFGCVPTRVVYQDILDAFNGSKPFADVTSLKSGKFSCTPLKTTKLASVQADLGYDFCTCADAYIAASVHAVGPTGTRPNGRFLFEPVAGANKSWQLGATFSGYKTWERSCNDVGLYWYLVGTHLFKARQTRVFNLCANGPGSQYLLVKEIDPSNSEVDSAERLANVFSGDVRIGADFMFDGSIMVGWNYECTSFALGYNFWFRSKEKRSKEVCFRNYHFLNSAYGVKGNQPLSTFNAFCADNQTTASTSTIGKPGPADLNNEGNPTGTVFIQLSDINYDVALHPTTWSHKVFALLSRQRTLCERTVYGQVGLSAEFSVKNKALNMVSGLIQGGIEF